MLFDKAYSELVWALLGPMLSDTLSYSAAVKGPMRAN